MKSAPDVWQWPWYLFAALTVGHVLLISAQLNTDRGVPVIEDVTFGTFAEAQRGISAAVGGVRTWWGDYVALQMVRDDNIRLRRELSQLQVTLQQERAMARQSRTLSRLLELRTQVPLATVAAAVIAGGASPEFRTLTIDKGTADGLRPNMAVLAPAGVIGRVVSPGSRAALVQLLIDRNAAVGVMVERSRAQGVAEGTGTEMRLNYVSGGDDVVAGDVAVTSGIDGIYPKGFVVGQIESVEREAGAFGAIRIQPAVDFLSLEVVLVVTSPPRLAVGDVASGPGTQAQE
ncbi:MAG: rod shape-determining protein MreC [Acidobacteria bacterium]|nr:rod shape-determining protein MreC [Acidobacteriota bacterium]